MPSRVPAVETGCLDVRASLASCWRQPGAGGKVLYVLHHAPIQLFSWTLLPF